MTMLNSKTAGTNCVSHVRLLGCSIIFAFATNVPLTNSITLPAGLCKQLKGMLCPSLSMPVHACVFCTHGFDHSCVCAVPKPQSPGKPSSGPKQELQMPPPPLQPVHQSASAAELASQANQAESQSEDEAEQLSSSVAQTQQPAAPRQQEFSSSSATAPPTTGSKPQQASKPTMSQASSPAAPPRQQQQQQQPQRQQLQAPGKAEQPGKAAAARDGSRVQKDSKQEVQLYELRIPT